MSQESYFRVSAHAERQIKRRGLTHEIIFDVLNRSAQIVELDTSKIAYQKIILFQKENKNYLVRVIVNTAIQPNLIITAYKTSKISKYYED